VNHSIKSLLRPSCSIIHFLPFSNSTATATRFLSYGRGQLWLQIIIIVFVNCACRFEIEAAFGMVGFEIVFHLGDQAFLYICLPGKFFYVSWKLSITMIFTAVRKYLKKSIIIINKHKYARLQDAWGIYDSQSVQQLSALLFLHQDMGSRCGLLCQSPHDSIELSNYPVFYIARDFLHFIYSCEEKKKWVRKGEDNSKHIITSCAAIGVSK
jgi:hypothetical protein